jgi:transposase
MSPGLVPQAEGLLPAADRRGAGGPRKGGQPVDEARPRRRPSSTPALVPTWGRTPVVGRPARPPACTLASRPGRVVLIWDGTLIHRSHTIQEFRANGAAQRLHLERLPPYAPELNPDKGIWAYLNGVELRNLCGFDVPHLRRELRDAVKRMRRKPRVIKSCFQGAGL